MADGSWPGLGLIAAVLALVPAAHASQPRSVMDPGPLRQCRFRRQRPVDHQQHGCDPARHGLCVAPGGSCCRSRYAEGCRAAATASPVICSQARASACLVSVAVEPGASSRGMEASRAFNTEFSLRINSLAAAHAPDEEGVELTAGVHVAIVEGHGPRSDAAETGGAGSRRPVEGRLHVAKGMAGGGGGGCSWAVHPGPPLPGWR